MNALGEQMLYTIGPRTALTVEQERAVIQDALDNPRAFYLIAIDVGRFVGMLDLHAGRKARENHAATLGISVAKN